MTSTDPRPRTLRAALVAGGLVATLATATATAPPAGAVIRGQEVPPGRTPWMAALIDADGEQFCGASIVAPDEILTAAHCVSDVHAADVTVMAGTTDLTDEAAQVVPVREIRVHRGYQEATSRNDVAVLLLRRPLTLGPRVQPVALVDATTQPALLAAGAPVMVMGWGATSDRRETYPTRLRAASLRIVADSTCWAEWEGGIDGATMLCGGSPSHADACGGDSGGPLVAFDRRTWRWVQVGVVSFGDTCDDASVPSVYADLGTLAPFVRGRGVGGTRR